jgi:radical SAM protein with 4Fe4S-binding SPASM domain
MPFSEVKEVIEEVFDVLKQWTYDYDINFSHSFNITGGEPFLHRDIFRILEEIKERGFDIYILSNGTLINKKKAEILSDLDINGVQVSIEGPGDVHDSIRGKGSFASSMLGIRHLLDSGIKVTINVTLSKLNEGYIKDIVSLASVAGVQNLGFSRLVPSGRGKKLLNEMLETRKVKEIYDLLLSIETEGLDIVTGDPVASQATLKGNRDMGYTAYGGCAAGISGLTLRPDGTINPCRRMNIPIGNIRKDSLRDVWATSEVLCMLRDRSKYRGKCGNCSRWANCRGCRAIAYAYSQSQGEGDFLAEDPQCFHENV